MIKRHVVLLGPYLIKSRIIKRHVEVLLGLNLIKSRIVKRHVEVLLGHQVGSQDCLSKGRLIVLSADWGNWVKIKV